MKSDGATIEAELAEAGEVSHTLEPRAEFCVERKSLRAPLPRVSRLLLRWFTWYSRGYLRRHFHSLRVSYAGLPPQTSGRPLVLYLNHASWWDPLVCLIVKAEFFPERRGFAPIDLAALRRYQFFRRLGFFGVEQNTRSGARQFLRTAESVLRHENHLLAITPQGRFADPRERPLNFQPGLGHLATRVQRAIFLPMAIEYVFWEERLPEILVHFGKAIEVNSSHAAGFKADSWSELLEQNLAVAQDELAVAAQRREAVSFQDLLRGGAGQGGLYDAWRSMAARWRGETFRREHGAK